MATSDVAVNLAQPKPQSMSESHLVRRLDKPCFPICCCCNKQSYKFVSPDGADHVANREYPSCFELLFGWVCCKTRVTNVQYTSAQGPDFESRKTLKCWRYCLCPCFDLCEPCCPCCQTCGKLHEIKDARSGGAIGTVRNPSCWESLCMCCFFGRARELFHTRDTGDMKKYVVRSDLLTITRKYPVTPPDDQKPIAWVTITAQRVWACGGFTPCYCGHRRSAALEVDHAHGLPFNDRAHLMSAAMKLDESWWCPVGCCCNKDE
mmetsp:Transcript_38927/g.71911  ORF Transcript_38927/g.71911 Transcript_38927/m.71911 type:complete len:263 (-) Transcript_38927:341-1129(-)|eukprot:TRINITY_DN23126_c0_g1_i1.p1 TRINITY_DN23126_c0_g1~~TRINITY_DN23126_c0_g1_i1.p1  ORF type:complete len:263 (+),score=40.51 TRINITY_DN23126_c0_g1_i1:40-828(+)